ncbi:MAG: EB domain-containing protein [Nanoarchaeota archaeon]|nr:EB domain-containing protein [Nanoarchaeota archaeon]
MKFRVLFLILFLLSMPLILAEEKPLADILSSQQQLMDDNKFITLANNIITIDGYKYKTSVNIAELNKIFDVARIRIGKRGQPTGEISLEDIIVKDVNGIVSTKKYSYGAIAGNIKINPAKSEIKIQAGSDKDAIYYNFGKNSNSLKSKEIILKKINIKRLGYGHVVAKAKGGKYLQNNQLLICDDCELSLHQMGKYVNVLGDAKLMQLETYQKEYKDANEEARNKLGPVKAMAIKNIDKLALKKCHFKFTDKLANAKVEGDLDMCMGAYPNKKNSQIGELNLRSYSGTINLGLINPKGRFSFKVPVYLIYALKLNIYGIPDKAVMHLELLKLKGDNKINIFENGKMLASLDGGSLVLKKDVKPEQRCRSQAFNWFNCLDINTNTNSIYVKLQDTKKSSGTYSPLEAQKTLNEKDSMLTLYRHTSYNDLYVDPIPDKCMLTIANPNAYINPSLTLNKGLHFYKYGYKILTGQRWYNFGTSFTAHAFNPKFDITDEQRDIYDTIRCELSTKKCSLNGLEMSKITKVSSCTENKNCPSNQVCINKICQVKPKITEVIPGSSKKPLKLLFIGNNIEKERFTKIIKDLLYYDSTKIKGLLKIEPYKSNADLFGIFQMDAQLSKELINNAQLATYFPDDLKSQIGAFNKVIIFSEQAGDSYVVFGKPDICYLSMNKPLSRTNIVTFVHEVGGHLISKLEDEYLIHRSGKLKRQWLRDNCIFATDSGMTRESAKANALKAWSKLFGQSKAQALVNQAVQNNWWSCGGVCDKDHCKNNLRQSDGSIMYTTTIVDKPMYWGQVSEAIIKETLNKYRRLA